MRVVIQRVTHASVTIEGVCKSAIKKGLLVLVGIEEIDNKEDIDWLCKKIDAQVPAVAVRHVSPKPALQTQHELLNILEQIEPAVVNAGHDQAQPDRSEERRVGKEC